jgi:hypothetical protein
MFELDRWVPQHSEELQSIARERARGQVDVSGLPISVGVSPATVLAGDKALAAAIASDAGEVLYGHGRTAFIDDEGARGDMSMTEPVRWAIGLLEERSHGAWQVAFVGSLLLLAVSLTIVLLTDASPGRTLVAVAIASAAFTVACMLLWGLSEVMVRLLGAPADSEVARLLAACARLGLQNGVIVGLTAVLLNLLRHQASVASAPGSSWPRTADEAA